MHPAHNNYVGYQSVGYQPQMAPTQLRQVPGQGVVVQVATKQTVPVMVTPAKVTKVANPVVVTQGGHQVVGTREQGQPNVVVLQKTLPTTAVRPGQGTGTIGQSAVTGQTVYRSNN